MSCHYTQKNSKRGPKPKIKKEMSVDCISETTSSESSISMGSTKTHAKIEHELDSGEVLANGLTSDHIVDALFGFQYRVSSFHPNSFILDTAIAVEFAGAMISGCISLLAVDVKFMYSVVLAHGFSFDFLILRSENDWKRRRSCTIW